MEEDVLLKVTYIQLKSIIFGYCTFPAPIFEFLNLYHSEPLKERLYQNDSIKIHKRFHKPITCKLLKYLDGKKHERKEIRNSNFGGNRAV